MILFYDSVPNNINVKAVIQRNEYLFFMYVLHYAFYMSLVFFVLFFFQKGVFLCSLRRSDKRQY